MLNDQVVLTHVCANVVVLHIGGDHTSGVTAGALLELRGDVVATEHLGLQCETFCFRVGHDMLQAQLGCSVVVGVAVGSDVVQQRFSLLFVNTFREVLGEETSSGFSSVILDSAIFLTLDDREDFVTQRYDVLGNCLQFFGSGGVVCVLGHESIFQSLIIGSV